MTEYEEDQEFISSRGSGIMTSNMAADMLDEIQEGRLVQREDRSSAKAKSKCKIDVCEQLKGNAKERWVKLFESNKKADRKVEERAEED